MTSPAQLKNIKTSSNNDIGHPALVNETEQIDSKSRNVYNSLYSDDHRASTNDDSIPNGNSNSLKNEISDKGNHNFDGIPREKDSSYHENVSKYSPQTQTDAFYGGRKDHERDETCQRYDGPVVNSNSKSNLISEMDLKRRQNIENTVRIIENILSKTTRSVKVNNNLNNVKHAESDEINNMATNESELSSETEDEGCISEPENIGIESIDQYGKSTSDTTYDRNKCDMENHAVFLTMNIKKSASDSETEEDVKTYCTTELNQSNANVDCIDIKIEQDLSWTDIDFSNPFQKDINSVSRNITDSSVTVEAKNSIDEAKHIVTNGLVPEKYFECPFCNLFFTHPKRFLIHTKWHTFGHVNVKAEMVAKEKDSLRKVKSEKQNAKEIIEPEAIQENANKEETDGKFPCTDCDLVFRLKRMLKTHKRKVHSKSLSDNLITRDCQICKETIRYQDMPEHLETHTTDSKYKCSDCPKTFKFPHSLAKHRDTHLEKIHPCSQCNKLFGSPASLKMHMKCHEKHLRGVKYRCSFCGKGYYEAFSVQIHERTHTNEKPFKCKICETSYHTNSSLSRHMKVSHSKSKPYECQTCHRCFSKENIRDRHEIRAHGDPSEFKFPCDLCTCRYLSLKDLRKHRYKVHPKSKRKKATSESE